MAKSVYLSYSNWIIVCVLCVCGCVCVCVHVFVCMCACSSVDIRILRKNSWCFKKKSKLKANRKGILCLFRDFIWRHFDVELTSIWRDKDVNTCQKSSMLFYLIVPVVSCSFSEYRMRYVDIIVEFSSKKRSLDCRNLWRFWRRIDVHLLSERPVSIELTCNTFPNTKHINWTPGDACKVKKNHVL